MNVGPGGSDPTLERLRRQAARDRAARIEAEGIAEVRLRLAYQRSADLELLAAVAILVNETADAEEALAATARAVRRHCGFAVAHVLMPDVDGALVSADVWDADPEQLDFFDRCLAATAQERFVPPRGLPGEVAHAHEARWLPDLVVATNVPRGVDVGGGSAWAFPVLVGTEVAAVVEFLDPRPRAVDTALLALSGSLGVQLAHAVRWDRILARGVADRARLEASVSAGSTGSGPPEELARLAEQAADALAAAGSEPELVGRIRAELGGGAGTPESVTQAPAVRAGSTVLVVDDNPVNRMLAGAMLGRIGVAHDLVDGGASALAALAGRSYDLVLMDVQMPDLDGRETTRRWRTEGQVGRPGASSAEVPVVALTAHVGEDERAACAAAGMDDFLSKPFGLAELEGLCRRWLGEPVDQPAR